MTRSEPLIEAVRRQEAARVAQRILAGEVGGDPALARRVRAACQTISARMIEERGSLIARFAARGIRSEAAPGPEDHGALQYYLAGLRVDHRDLAGVIESATEAGYRLPFHAAPGQIDALARYVPKLVLARDDATATRIALTLTGARARRNALTPTAADIAVADLPGPLSGLYAAVRLLRVLGNRLSGRRAPHSDSDSLGTPESLIGPLLDVAGPGEDDLLVDLGCGDGRIVAAAAELYGCRAIGVEANPALADLARRRIEARGGEIAARAEIREGYAESADLDGASIVFLFLPVFLLGRLMPLVLSRVRPGTRIVAHEQSPLRGVPEPQNRRLIVTSDAMTVASVWRAA